MQGSGIRHSGARRGPPSGQRRDAVGKTVGKWILVFAVTVYVAAYGADTLRYISFGVTRGDWLNDWLTHLPFLVQELVHALH